MYCEKCDRSGEYSDQWDAWYCPWCKEWLEGICDCDPNLPKDHRDYCPFETWKRPEKP